MIKPDKDHVKAFYDQHYYADIKGAGVPTRHHINLTARLGLANGEKLLDVACGTGEWLKAVAGCGGAVSGVDLSEKAIEFCQTDNPSGDFYCQSADALPFDNGYFDWVSCLGSLEHFPEKPDSLAEMARVLRPGGQLLISVPNIEFVGYRTGLYGGTNQARVIETPLRIEEWVALGEGAGLLLREKWKDLHFLNPDWILQNGWLRAIPRGLGALAIAALPLSMQYQVYFRFTKPLS
jgi:SAM-dependent methyltransferase